MKKGACARRSSTEGQQEYEDVMPPRIKRSLRETPSGFYQPTDARIARSFRKRRVQIRGVKDIYPARTRGVQRLKAAPAAQPKEFFLDRAQCPFSINTLFECIYSAILA